VLLERKPVQIPDVLADPEYINPEPQRLGGYRTHQAQTRLIWYNLFGSGHPIRVYMGGLHHVARKANFEPKESDESRNGIGSRWGVVAGGRRVRGSR
jgi:hypothetical protein